MTVGADLLLGPAHAAMCLWEDISSVKALRNTVTTQVLCPPKARWWLLSAGQLDSRMPVVTTGYPNPLWIVGLRAWGPHCRLANRSASEAVIGMGTPTESRVTGQLTLWPETHTQFAEVLLEL